MATNYARLKNQNKFENHILFSVSFYKINELNQRNDETEIFINLNFNDKLTESDTTNNDVKSHLEHQIEIQETDESGWKFDKIMSMK